jgi:Ca2+-binding EF-hand superfamily protein
MKRTVLILSLLSITATAWAQTPPAANDERRPGVSREQSEQRREQYKQRFEADFKKADTDADGALSKAEAEKSMPRLAREFAAIDANKDGKLTQDEIRTYMQARMAAHHGGKSAEQGKQHFDEMFKKADTDGDGALSKAEAEKSMPRLARDFDAIDGNKDGKVTQDELRSFMVARRAEHHKGMGAGPGKTDTPKPQ